MRQLIHDLGSGQVRIEEVPQPVGRPGGILVRTAFSVVSPGTERAAAESARESVLTKVLQRPSRVRDVLEAAVAEGFRTTYVRTKNNLSRWIPCGYSVSGIVEHVGEGATEFSVGQAVACAGASYAFHAERIWVPTNLAVPVPDGVPLDTAAFATLGAIALHGARQAEIGLGETVVVIGLGVLGQLSVQLVRAAGGRPIAIDLEPDRVQVAENHGALGILREDDVSGRIHSATDGVGADAVLVTAATQSDDPVRLAGEIARDRGRVVIVGDVAMQIPRAPYYRKELQLRLSRSYGPGRYDPQYEEKGKVYPVSYVRWTQTRNLEEFLRLVGEGAVSLEGLVTHRYPFEQGPKAYDLLVGEKSEGALGVVLEYSGESTEPARVNVRGAERRQSSAQSRSGNRIAVVGSGSFAAATLIPILKDLGAELIGVSSGRGLSAANAARQFGFRYAASSPEEMFADPDVDAVVIATRHDLHASLAVDALRAGKSVFVEKPLALDQEGLDEVMGAASDGGVLTVGFNRRFAPATRFVKERLEGTSGARVVQIRVNAGAIPGDSWVHDPEEGGGRLIGEGCHFIDLALFLAGSDPTEVYAAGVGVPDADASLNDNVQVILKCVDGSLAGITYTAKGEGRSGKERIEIYAGRSTGIIDDFRLAEFWMGRRQVWKGKRDKGHRAQLKAFLDAVRDGEPAPIPLRELELSSRATLLAARSLTTGHPELV